MSSNEVIAVGEKADVEYKGKSYRTRVENVFDNNSFLLSHPTEKGYYVPFHISETVQINIYKPNGLFCFDAILMGQQAEDQLRCLRFIMSSELRKHQRREAFRLPISLNIDVQEWVDPPRPDLPNPWTYKTRTVDISEGGILILSPHNCYIDNLMQLTVHLKDKDPMNLSGVIKRCIWPLEKGLPYKIAIQFSDITSRNRQILAKYIVEAQLRQLR